MRTVVPIDITYTYRLKLQVVAEWPGDNAFWRLPTSSRSGKYCWVGPGPPPLSPVPRHRRVPGHGLQSCQFVSAVSNSMATKVALQLEKHCKEETPHGSACAVFREIGLFIIHFSFLNHWNQFETRNIGKAQTLQQSGCHGRSEWICTRAPRWQPAMSATSVICHRSARRTGHVGCWVWALSLRKAKASRRLPYHLHISMAGLGGGENDVHKKALAATAAC